MNISALVFCWDGKNIQNDGLDLIHKILINILEKYSIKKIDVKEDTIFDPAFHEVINIEQKCEKENNSILKVLQTGYTIHNQILRYSKVSISKKQI